MIFALSPGPAAAAEPEGLLLAPAGQGEAEALPQPAAQEPQIPEGQPFAENNLGDRIAVRPLDDPANPYLGQYGEWDRWLIAQWQPGDAPESYFEQYKGRDFTAPPLGYGFRVSPEGWVLPLLSSSSFAGAAWQKPEETLADWVTRDRTKLGEDQRNTFGIWIYQPLPDDLYNSYEMAKGIAMADTTPVIPPWIGEAPPLATVFLENGEICCYGEMGQRFAPADDRGMYMLPAGLSWYRYSSEGELLDRIDRCGNLPDHQWIQFYFPDFREILLESKGYARGYYGPYFVLTRTLGEGGEYEVSFSGSAKREIVSAYRYTGEAVDASAVVFESNNYYSALRPEQIQQAFRGQLATGLTAADSRSPFEGLTNGPQMAARPMIEVPMPELASRGSLHDEMVLIRPLDDPASPFAGRYTTWDSWLYECINQSSPQMQRKFEERQAEFERLRAEAHKAGSKEPEMDFLLQPLVYDPEDDWRRASMRFTPQGHMIPLADWAWSELSARRFVSWSTRDFSDTDWFGADGGGFLSSEDFLAFNTYRWQCAASRVPQIPDWLASQPVMRAVLLANGEVLTMGPLGSWTDSDEGGDELARDSFEALWFRYSPDGELLGRGYRGGNWAQFYSSALPELEARAEAASHRVYCIGEYIFIRGTREDPTLQVYNWAGEEVEFSPALFGEMLYGEELSWRTLRNVVKVRAGEAVTIEP